MNALEVARAEVRAALQRIRDVEGSGDVAVYYATKRYYRAWLAYDEARVAYYELASAAR